ncbi:MAG: alpha/beta hydrolase [Chlorobiaceae bacterium]|nr:alpha/beta hydrolase [Chlorobiaceae bacterium]
MGNTPTPSSRKFQDYREKLLARQQSQNSAEQRRATYELSLMEDSHFIDVGGLLHHYHDSGPRDAKETVLLIHGWDCWWMWWHHVIKALNKAGIRTVAYDMKGHGWSENDPANHYHIDHFARDLDELVRKLDLRNFHVAAFSFGPFVALDYVRRYENSVKSMVFFNFGFLPNSEMISKVATTTLTFVFNNMMRKLTWWVPAYIFARLVLAKNTVMQHDIMIGFESLGLCASEAIEQTTCQIASLETTNMLPEMVKSVKVPIMFVAGEGDSIMTSENTKKLQELAGNGTYVCVPECGHLITLELPDTASALVLRQVRAHS